MSRYIKDSTGKLVKFANKLLYMLEHVYNEGVYYLRVLAGGGTVANRGLVEDLYKLWEEQERLDNIKVAILPQAGGVQRTSGIYRFFSRLFNLGAGVKYNATQLVSNGNFEASSLSSVYPLDSVNTYDAVNKLLVNTTSGTASYGRVYLTQTSKIVNDKYYYSVKVRVLQSANYLRIYFANFTGNDANISSPAVNQWYTLSTIATVSSSATSTISVGHNYTTPVAGNVANIDEIKLINLTATFGAGNEPTKEVCDVIFADYFDGTKEIQLNDVTQGVANSQPYFVNGAMVNPNGASRFMTHPTVSFGVEDAWSFSCVVKINNGLGSSYGASFLPDGPSNGLHLADSQNSISYRTSSYSFLPSIPFNTKALYGKTVLITAVSLNREILIYINAVYIGKTTNTTNDQYTFSTTNFFNGKIGRYGTDYMRLIQSGALTPTQILEEYNLLRSYIPEIATTLIGTKNIATENCQMVATPMGRVINLNNTAGNVEKITDIRDREFSEDTGFWTKAVGVLINDAGSGVASGVNVAGGLFFIRRESGFTENTWKRATFEIKNYSAGGVKVTDGAFVYGSTYNSNGVKVLYYFGVSTRFRLEAVGITTLDIDNVSVEEIGFAGASDLYTAIYNQTTGTVAQKTSAAILAAAMWRSPNSSLDDQAVFGKIYNGYAAQLLQMDIDAYNAANPSTPWGYHVATLQDFQAIKDTLGGVETAGKKIKINGTDYWTSDNGDNTSGVQALGSGYIDENGEYKDYKEATGFWTVTENGDMLEVVTLRDELDELFITE